MTSGSAARPADAVFMRVFSFADSGHSQGVSAGKDRSSLAMSPKVPRPVSHRARAAVEPSIRAGATSPLPARPDLSCRARSWPRARRQRHGAARREGGASDEHPLLVSFGAGRARSHISRIVGGASRRSGRFGGRRADPAAGRMCVVRFPGPHACRVAHRLTGRADFPGIPSGARTSGSSQPGCAAACRPCGAWWAACSARATSRRTRAAPPASPTARARAP
jgi:hypothetical protein